VKIVVVFLVTKRNTCLRHMLHLWYCSMTKTSFGRKPEALRWSVSNTV